MQRPRPSHLGRKYGLHARPVLLHEHTVVIDAGSMENATQRGQRFGNQLERPGKCGGVANIRRKGMDVCSLRFHLRDACARRRIRLVAPQQRERACSPRHPTARYGQSQPAQSTGNEIGGVRPQRCVVFLQREHNLAYMARLRHETEGLHRLRHGE